jgi:hypothetical protein
MNIIQGVRKDAIVLVIGGSILFATTSTINPDSLYLVALFSAASILGFGIGLWQGAVWYQAGHWLPLAAIALMVAIAPSDSLIELSGLTIIIGVVNLLFAPLYYWFEQSGKDLLK